MMEHEVKLKKGIKRDRKRVGRGDGSGRGTYSGKGLKGQKARSGSGIRPGFEGGQLPLIKRLPEKRGFTNPFKKKFVLIKVGLLNQFDEHEEVTPQKLLEQGLIPNQKLPINVLGDGEISKPLVVHAHRFSNAAKRKIEESGGRAEKLLS